MSNTIQIKRKTTSGAPSAGSLATGELCYVLPDKHLYIKNDDATVTLVNVAAGGITDGNKNEIDVSNSGADWQMNKGLIQMLAAGATL